MNNNTLLGDALQKALDSKKNDYSNFIWKGEKRKEGKKYVQESEKLVDMTPERLKECWKHCEKMLHNDDPRHLGRYNVLEEVTSQINKCNVELLLRYFENTYQKRENITATKRFSLMITLRQLMSKNPDISDWSTISIFAISNDLPDEFKDINVADILEGCIDNLGSFNKQHLTLTFLTKMGLWFTKAEEQELKSENNSNIERLNIAKERLHIPSELSLRISEKGLSYHEMRAMLTLQKKQKYSDMTTEQLVTLRNKVLLRLSREVDKHIFNWKHLQTQIELVAKSKNIDLND
jgi:hypothetical protein